MIQVDFEVNRDKSRGVSMIRGFIVSSGQLSGTSLRDGDLRCVEIHCWKSLNHYINFMKIPYVSSTSQGKITPIFTTRNRVSVLDCFALCVNNQRQDEPINILFQPQRQPWSMGNLDQISSQNSMRITPGFGQRHHVRHNRRKSFASQLNVWVVETCVQVLESETVSLYEMRSDGLSQLQPRGNGLKKRGYRFREQRSHSKANSY